MQTRKSVHQLKAGDIVSFEGARFRILFNAMESRGHRKDSGLTFEDFGPGDTAYTIGEWISGQIIPGYFGPKDNWTFQGNYCVSFSVESEA